MIYMKSSAIPAFLMLAVALAVDSASAFVASSATSFRRTLTFVGYRSTATSDATSEAAPFGVDSFYDHFTDVKLNAKNIATDDPTQVEFVSLEEAKKEITEPNEAQQQAIAAGFAASSHYPFAAMMQGSAAYIADHAGKIAVFHLPGEILEGPSSNAVLARHCALLVARHENCHCYGLSLPRVRSVQDDDSCTMEYAHECHNVLKVTDRETLRNVEEEAGYLRTEIERKLNRCLRIHGASVHSNDGSAPPEGNVVSGNFYTGQQIGHVRGEDYQYTGFAKETHTRNIMQVLNNNDVVVLTTVGLSPMGELVNVNGYHLAATVAASLGASKLIYMANQGCVLQRKGDRHSHSRTPAIVC